jgi:hypothetical protein
LAAPASPLERGEADFLGWRDGEAMKMRRTD